GKWEPVKHDGGRGRPTRKFCLFRLSTSTQFGIMRGETEISVDVDNGSNLEITPQEVSDHVPTPPPFTSTQFPLLGSEGELPTNQQSANPPEPTLTGDEKGVARL